MILAVILADLQLQVIAMWMRMEMLVLEDMATRKLTDNRRSMERYIDRR